MKIQAAFLPLLSLFTFSTVVYSHASPHPSSALSGAKKYRDLKISGRSVYHGSDHELVKRFNDENQLERLRLAKRSGHKKGKSGLNLQEAERIGRQHIRHLVKKMKNGGKGIHFTIDKVYHDKDTEVYHVYAIQVVHGVKVENARANVSIDRHGKVICSGISFTDKFDNSKKHSKLVRRRQQIDPLDAMKDAVEFLGLKPDLSKATSSDITAARHASGIGRHFPNEKVFAMGNAKGVRKDPEAELTYYQTGDGSLKLTWKLDIATDNEWLIAFSDTTEKKKIHAVGDYRADASYEVFQLGINDPNEGERIVVTDPFKKKASPFGWHRWQESGDDFTTTKGNNGLSMYNPMGDLAVDIETLYRPDVGSSLEFKFPFTAETTDQSVNTDAAITQLFYTANIYHDLLEELGFHESAGNFEYTQTGEGGIGTDFVALHAQFGATSGNPEFLNNAFFETPPDGQRPTMMMFLWESGRDGDFDNGIIIHEYTHGLSNRLTGGPQNVLCLQNPEGRGMGEGWSDFYATAIRVKIDDTRDKTYPMGDYVINPGIGIREYHYSTNLQTNPLLYSSLNQPERIAAPHATGTVWATMLYEVLWNIIDKHGMDTSDPYSIQTIHKDGCAPKDGRHLAMKIVLEAMKLQPCLPTFMQARDAIVEAEKAITKGKYTCEIWKGFAKRGLGTDAVDSNPNMDTTVRTDGFGVPTECGGEEYPPDDYPPEEEYPEEPPEEEYPEEEYPEEPPEEEYPEEEYPEEPPEEEYPEEEYPEEEYPEEEYPEEEYPEEPIPEEEYPEEEYPEEYPEEPIPEEEYPEEEYPEEYPEEPIPEEPLPEEPLPEEPLPEEPLPEEPLPEEPLPEEPLPEEPLPEEPLPEEPLPEEPLPEEPLPEEEYPEEEYPEEYPEDEETTYVWRGKKFRGVKGSAHRKGRGKKSHYKPGSHRSGGHHY